MKHPAKRNLILGLVGGALLTMPYAASAEDYLISVKNGAFVPKELTIPKDQKVKITIKNLDATPMEFESHELNREKVIPAGGQAHVFVGPLAAGSYPFFDEFNEKNTGSILVK